MRGKILLDTNFLLIPAQFGVDIFAEFERVCDFPFDLFVLDRTIGELKGIIKNQSGKNKEASNLALSLIEQKGVKIIETKSELLVDDLILNFAEEGYIVATQDMELSRKLKNRIILRQKRYLVLEKCFTQQK